jgi:hypothetical protein
MQVQMYRRATRVVARNPLQFHYQIPQGSKVAADSSSYSHQQEKQADWNQMQKDWSLLAVVLYMKTVMVD